MTEMNSKENTQKGSESLALILGVVSIPLSMILFGFVTSIAGCLLSWSSWKTKGAVTGKTAMAITFSLLGLFASTYFAYSYRQMFLRWYGLQDESRALIGEKVPPISVTDINGVQIDTSLFKGEKIVVNLWATWCSPCKREIPHFSKLAAEYKDRVLFIGISEEQPEAIREFTNSMRISYALVSEKLRNLPAPLNAVKAYPTTFILNQNGTIEDLKVGYLPEKTLKKWLDERKLNKQPEDD